MIESNNKITIIGFILIAILAVYFLTKGSHIKAISIILVLAAAPIFIRNERNLFLFWVLTSPIVNRFIDPKLGASDIIFSNVNLRELLNFDRIVMIFLVIIEVFQKREHERSINSKTFKYMSLFSLVLILNCLTLSINKFHSIRVAIDGLIIPFLSFYLGAKYSGDIDFMKKFVVTILILGIYISFGGIVELYLSGNIYHRVSGPFPFWETFGLLQTCTFFIAAYSVMVKKGNTKLATFCLMFSLLGIALTYTRTIWFSFLLSILLMFVMSKKLKASRSYLKKLLLTLASGVAVLLLITGLGSLEKRLTTQDTIDNRLETYQFAWNLFLKNPLLGVGFKNFRSFYGGEELDFEATHSNPGRSELHSSYLAILCELGVVGLLLFLCVFWSIFREGRSLLRIPKSEEQGSYVIIAMGVTAVTFLSGFSFNPFYDSFMVGKLQFFIMGTMFYGNNRAFSRDRLLAVH